jgi:hypothetical protein
MCVLLLHLLHMQQHSSTDGGGPGGQSGPLPYRSRECMCVLLLYLLHMQKHISATAAPTLVAGVQGGQPAPRLTGPASVCVCSDVPLAQCSSTTVLVAGVKGGSQPPCLAG